MTKSLTSYDILNIDANASQDDIHMAYRRLAKNWHPDRHNNGNKDRADENFKLLQEAYNNLKNPSMRSDYNRKLSNLNRRIMADQNKIMNDNSPLSRFFKNLENLFQSPNKNKGV